MQQDTHILLLHKRSSGDLAADEHQALEQWLEASPEHAQTAVEWQQVWDVAGQWQPSVSVNMDADFAAIQRKIAVATTTAQQQSSVAVKRSLMPTLLRAAAAVVVLIAGMWAFGQWQSTGNGATVMATTAQAKEQVNLPDGTKVWLRRAATVQYPNTFDAATRAIQLNGEAYFEVAHNPAQPFSVAMPDGSRVEVLGTKFVVKADKDAPRTEVVVREGKVRFSYKNQSAILVAGDKAVLDRATGQLKKMAAGTLNDIAWQTGRLEFEATPLQTVVADLEKHFNVSIELKNTALRQCPFTLSSDRPIGSILQAIAASNGMQIETPAQGRYVLTGGACPN